MFPCFPCYVPLVVAVVPVSAWYLWLHRRYCFRHPSQSRPAWADGRCCVAIRMAHKRRGGGSGPELWRTLASSDQGKGTHASPDGQTTKTSAPRRESGRRDGGAGRGGRDSRRRRPRPRALSIAAERTVWSPGGAEGGRGSQGGTRARTLAGQAIGHDATGGGFPTSRLTFRHLGNLAEGQVLVLRTPRERALRPAMGP